MSKFYSGTGDYLSRQDTCCDIMFLHVNDDSMPIKYYNKYRQFAINLLDIHAEELQFYIGGSYNVMSYCPWCSCRLPENLRCLYYRKLENLLGEKCYDMKTSEYPTEYQSDKWWRDLGLVNEHHQFPKKGYKKYPCCDSMYRLIIDERSALKYDSINESYGLNILDLDEEVIDKIALNILEHINYCPWCAHQINLKPRILDNLIDASICK